MLDVIDLKIINSVMEDARKSFRTIAREVGLSTPTVKARFDRLLKIGVIKRIMPIIDVNAIANKINAIVMLKSKPSNIHNLANKLAEFEEVRSVYLLSSNNLMLLVTVANANELDEFINKISSNDVMDISSQLITRIIKDEPLALIDIKSMIKVRCEYCNKEVSKPLVAKIKGYNRYFCCTSCITLYKSKYRV